MIRLRHRVLEPGTQNGLFVSEGKATSAPAWPELNLTCPLSQRLVMRMQFSLIQKQWIHRSIQSGIEFDGGGAWGIGPGVAVSSLKEKT
ncbi:MAG: hypothetical protein ACKO8I_14310 [Cyanobacteriota bacterium]